MFVISFTTFFLSKCFQKTETLSNLFLEHFSKHLTCHVFWKFENSCFLQAMGIFPFGGEVSTNWYVSVHALAIEGQETIRFVYLSKPFNK